MTVGSQPLSYPLEAPFCLSAERLIRAPLRNSQGIALWDSFNQVVLPMLQPLVSVPARRYAVSELRGTTGIMLP